LRVDHDIRRAAGLIQGFEQRGNVLLVGGIAAMDRCLCLFRKRSELVGLAGRKSDRQPVRGEQAGQRSAEARAGPDD
jgi:hypothetical protein